MHPSDLPNEVIGYLDRWSVAPGDTVAVHLSSERPVSARLDLIRLGRGTERAEPGGILFEPVLAVDPQSIEVQPQPLDIGSYAVLDGLNALQLSTGTLALLVCPWCIDGTEQTLAAMPCDATTLRVTIDSSGHFALHVGTTTARTAQRAMLRRWMLLSMSWSAAAVTLETMDARAGRRTTARLQYDGLPLAPQRLILAGTPMDDGVVGLHFDGRLERPVIWPHHPPADAIHAALLRDIELPAGAAACWDMAPGDHDSIVLDCGPHRLHGRLVQGPKRGVRGARWNGSVLDWHHAPEQYAAVHFHRDDLIDAAWKVSARVELPSTLPSGAYALRVRCTHDAHKPTDGEAPGAALDASMSLTGGTCRLPLFVRASATPASDPGLGDTVAVVFPTLTYLAYGNDRCALHGHNPEVLADCAIALEPTEVLLSRHPEWGLSLYDTHHDGSGVSIASRHRPIPTFQPDQRSWQAGEGSGR